MLWRAIYEPERYGYKVEENDLLMIDRDMGIAYCMESEELYMEVLAEFCSQMDIYIPQFAEFFKDERWADYAVIAHAVKSNSRTIGATAFADVSFKHECAGKTGDITYIRDNYEEYIQQLKELVASVRKML